VVELGLALFRCEMAEIGEGKVERPVRLDDLDRLAGNGMEGGAQDLVAADDLGEGTAERVDVERSAQAQGVEDDVGGAARDQLVQEPEPLLGEGQRQGGQVVLS
jgi:hypothetical protein